MWIIYNKAFMRKCHTLPRISLKYQKLVVMGKRWGPIYRFPQLLWDAVIGDQISAVFACLVQFIVMNSIFRSYLIFLYTTLHLWNNAACQEIRSLQNSIATQICMKDMWLFLMVSVCAPVPVQLVTLHSWVLAFKLYPDSRQPRSAAEPRLECSWSARCQTMSAGGTPSVLQVKQQKHSCSQNILCM